MPKYTHPPEFNYITESLFPMSGYCSLNAVSKQYADFMLIQDALKQLSLGKTLSASVAYEIFNQFTECGVEDQVSDAQIGAYLFASGLRLPTAEELTGAARCLRERMLSLDLRGSSGTLVDTSGTGGSGLNAFNTSTVAAFVAAASGLLVVKHGNRAITSSCGSADLLEALGINLNLTPEQAAKSLAETSFVFLFAPNYHPATKRVQGIRRQLGLRTIFNYLGPLCNPAGVKRQLLGVSSNELVRVMADTLASLGTEHSLVVSGEDGLDEVTLAGKTYVAEVMGSNVREYTVSPEEFGIARAAHAEFSGADAETSVGLVRGLLKDSGKDRNARREIVELNAGAVLYLGDKAASWKEGVEKARLLIESGQVQKTLEKIINFHNIN